MRAIATLWHALAGALFEGRGLTIWLGDGTCIFISAAPQMSVNDMGTASTPIGSINDDDTVAACGRTGGSDA